MASSRGPTEVLNARRTESSDAPAILSLVTKTTIEQFGNVNIVHLIEKSNLAVTLINEENEILGFAGFLDYPQLEVSDSAKWESWMRNAGYATAEQASPMNSLFMHFFVAKTDYTIGCGSEIVRTVFNAVPDLHFLFLILRNDSKPEHALSQIFKPVDGKKDADPFMLYGCYRHSHVPVLHIRRAVVEDNDDLLPIFTRLNDSLTQIYGDHFLAEMIEAQNEDYHAMVAEVGGKAVGFLSISNDVNTDILQKEYELTPFHGLLKPHPDDKLPGTDAPADKEAEEDSTTENTNLEPEYHGASNCFSIQLFCIDELYEMRSADFLPHLFRLFPGKDFAVITVPHLVPEFPLLQHFVRVTPKNATLVSQELYIFSRGGLLADFRVRQVGTQDIEKVEKLVASLDAKEDILSDMKAFIAARRDPDGTEIQAFVAESLGQVVGVASVRREEDIEFIRAHYNIEDFIYFNHHRRDEHGHLHHFNLNPVFQHYSKQFFKEILRQGHKSSLYYPVYQKDNAQTRHSLITGINHLVPVRVRRQIIYPLEELGINAPSERITKDMPHYALYHINRKLTLEPKVTVNARIVVVGASSVGISFLETLTFCPHLRFNNLSLVSKTGLPKKVQSASFSYTPEQLACMSLSTWVNIVEGTVVAIDRAHKYVVLENGDRVAYDYLILCTGQQYQAPHPTEALVEEGATNHNISPRLIERPYLNGLPQNFMVVNEVADERRVMEWLDRAESFPGKIVLYGNCLDVYCTLQDFIVRGIPGDKLVLVQPPTSHLFTEPDNFQEPSLVAKVSAEMQKAGIETHRECVLASWSFDPENPNVVDSVSFTTQTKPLILPCHVFLSFHPSCIDHSMYKAVNDACLVFDGRLVIDSKFRTNDPSIRAAGPLTKYARRYHAEDWSNHDGYNSCEVGFRLAMSVLPLFDPTLESVAYEMEDPNDPYTKLTPVFTDCKVFHGILPGNLEYLHIRKPGPSQAYEPQLANPNHGREVETGSVEDGNYFRLHMNQMGCVETITCVVKAGDLTLPVLNFIQLYNLHERYLNNLLSRVDEGLIQDLYEYFREPWCMAIFHDRFRDLKQEVYDLTSLHPPGGEKLPTLEEDVRQLVKEDLNVDKFHMQTFKEFYNNTGMRKSVEKRLLSFLSYNYYHLPMYAKPGMV